MLKASFLFSGYSDYFGGHGCDDDSEHLLHAYYGRDTSLRDIIDYLVEDSWNGPASETLPEDVTDDDVRVALLAMLSDQGRMAYDSGALAECSVDWMEGADDEEDSESPVFIVLLETK